VSSHTASMAGDYEVFSSALAQYGVVEAKDEFELIPFCEALCCYQKPIAGNIGIITGVVGMAPWPWMRVFLTDFRCPP